MLFECNNERDLREYSSLSLAFIGDGVYELLVRRMLLTNNCLPPNRLHSETVKYVSAKAQFRSLQAIEGMLNEQEQAVVRRGKNATKATVAKHATPQEYRAATALEALFGFLYLNNNFERIYVLFEQIVQHHQQEIMP